MNEPYNPLAALDQLETKMPPSVQSRLRRHGLSRLPAPARRPDRRGYDLRRAPCTLEVLAPDADKPAGYAAAGRTDAGVSALAQTIALETPDWLAPRALNAELPADVRARGAAADAPEGFHATHHANRRAYTYHLYMHRKLRRRTTIRPIALDDERFRAACEALSGAHDVYNLTPDDHNTERSPSLEAVRDGDYLLVTVSADGFARELVRRLVSLARNVGAGDAPLAKIDRVLDPDPLPGHGESHPRRRSRSC